LFFFQKKIQKLEINNERANFEDEYKLLKKSITTTKTKKTTVGVTGNKSTNKPHSKSSQGDRNNSGILTVAINGWYQSFLDPAISSDSDWSPKFGLGLGPKKSWLSYTLTQNYQSMKYLWRFNYSRYLCIWFIKGIIGF
jgi:hypothetical protein